MKDLQHRSGVMLVIGAICCSPRAAAQPMTLAPIQDTYILSAQPDSNFGGNPEFLLGSAGVFDPTEVGFVRGLFQFDLSSVPETVTSAKLRLFESATAPMAGTMSTYLFPITTPWNETLVTWNHQPTFDRGDNPGPVQAWGFSAWGTAEVGAIGVGGGPENRWIEWDITELIRSQTSGRIANHGWAIVSTPDLIHAGASRFGYFVSRDKLNDPKHWPQLVVEVPEPATVGLVLSGSLAMLTLGVCKRRRLREKPVATSIPNGDRSGPPVPH